ncbi:S-methyl-5-thioribose-1-phosphate isomerase [Micromonospora sp. Llam7]|uniref:S-methyl-5-thioribose-1-phosphate isomerase n=1 Tax=Micromonospora tarapacensis TaxID=2835305 RepID=UPI001C82B08C|nr:S-methyl-5-thioribose-1-phosphate isomerase [Micromonospora tarapacensis]MBX7267866.1 S-methyl-5-thioribose-1-phosphate isomerase [Micromonospora tarapacensis]
MRAIDWRDDGAVVIVDQTRLPDRTTFLVLREPLQLVAEIKRLAVRGAMALGVAGAMGVALGAVRAKERGQDVLTRAGEAAELLATARPTATNLAWGANRALAAAHAGAAAVVAVALEIRDEDVEANRAIGNRGADLLQGARRILTHCNAGALAAVEIGTALGVIVELHRREPLLTAYATETRPLLQGARLTTWELGRAGIPHCLVVDGAAAGLILAGEVDAVVVGADRIAANGDSANKVGTVAHALAAAHAGIPFVVAAPEATFSPGTATSADIPIEQRDEAEVLGFGSHRIAPPGTKARNPAFDVTPAELITAIVTERRTVWLGRATTGARPVTRVRPA